MDSDPGGQNFDDKQRKAAADIARQRVLSAYSNNPETYAEATPKINEAEWAKYHSAWRDYYQRYYGEYYNKAATDYIAAEKLRLETKQKTEEKAEPKPTEEAQATAIKTFRENLQEKTSGRAKKVRNSRHFIPILVGITITLVILFLQYNRNLLAPIIAYVSPGNVSASEITEIDPTVSRDPGPESKLIIPKINVDVPINFGVGNDNKSLNAAMEKGVVHFSIPGASAMPGEVGNLSLSGHSAGDVYNTWNEYKFIFSGLERLTNGDLIYVNYNSKRYTYVITNSRIVAPTDVAALTDPVDKPILTLITCTPLGTSEKRLIIYADQISPSPDSAPTPSDTTPPEVQTEMPANDPTFFERVWNFITGNND